MKAQLSPQDSGQLRNAQLCSFPWGPWDPLQSLSISSFGSLSIPPTDANPEKLVSFLLATPHLSLLSREPNPQQWHGRNFVPIGDKPGGI